MFVNMNPMKRNLSPYILILIWAVFWSCKDQDAVFEQTADQRINAALEAYQKQLVEAPSGWKGVIYPGAGGVYSFYFKFNNQNRVVMYSDFDKETAVTAKESSYRIKALQNPSLIFDTYSYLHILADPDAGVNDGEYGEGLKSDFEFSFKADSLNNGTLTLIGTKNRTRLLLTKATQEEAAAYGAGGLGKSLLFSNIASYLSYFKRITLGSVTYEILVNQRDRTVTFNWLVGSTLNSFTSEYYYSSLGVILIKPFTNGSQTINGFTDITWDATKFSLGLTAAGVKAVIEEAAKPLKVDTSAPRTWYNIPVATDGYWVNLDGFHINGVDDALKVNSLKSGTSTYYFYFYWPKFAATYDAFGPAFWTGSNAALIYADAPGSPTFTSDGRVVFANTGTLGTYPTDGTAAPAIAMRNQLYDSNGYYLIKLSDTAYDMVGAKDGKTWISWIR
jgi:hypothetical protein